MDGGVWFPLRNRHLPRLHHTGSYRLYPGEWPLVGPLVTTPPSPEQGITLGRASLSRRRRGEESLYFKPFMADRHRAARGGFSELQRGGGIVGKRMGDHKIQMF